MIDYWGKRRERYPDYSTGPFVLQRETDRRKTFQLKSELVIRQNWVNGRSWSQLELRIRHQKRRSAPLNETKGDHGWTHASGKEMVHILALDERLKRARGCLLASARVQRLCKVWKVSYWRNCDRGFHCNGRYIWLPIGHRSVDTCPHGCTDS